MALQCGLQNLGYTCFLITKRNKTLVDLYNGVCKFITIIGYKNFSNL